jgi:hypothetical protein
MTPEIHLHLADTSIGQILTNRSNSRDEAGQDINSTSGPGKRKRTSDVHDNHSDSDDEVDDSDIILPLKAVFTTLDKKYPDINYSKYQPTFEKHEICYATAIQDFPRDFFIKDIGMPAGAVGDFLRNIDTMVKKEKKQLKRVKRAHGESEKENMTAS